MSTDSPDAKIIQLVEMAQSPEHAELLVTTSFPNLTPEEVKEVVRQVIAAGDKPGSRSG